MKRLLFFALLLSLTNSILAQEPKTNTTLTEKQNLKWLTKFKKLTSKSEQIANIKQKIFADSIFIRRYVYCGTGLPHKQTTKKTEKNYCECKILFVLHVKNKWYVINPNKYPKTNRILQLVNDKNIDKITVYKGVNAEALFGKDAHCGVIVMQSDNRKLKKQIRQILQQNE